MHAIRTGAHDGPGYAHRPTSEPTLLERMTPRDRVAWIDVAAAPIEVLRRIAASSHRRFPICHGRVDHVLGVADLAALRRSAAPDDVWALLDAADPPLFLSSREALSSGLRAMERHGAALALVLDEHALVVGIVTRTDLTPSIRPPSLRADAPADPLSVVAG